MKMNYPEGASPLSPDELKGLLIPTISNRDELDRWEQDNILKAIDWTDKVEPDEILSESFMKRLHKEMFGDVWGWAGEFRRSNKNIGVDWKDISVELKKLLDDVRRRLENDSSSVADSLSPDDMGARFHHRLVQIHLFPNGNGRHARLAADLLMEKLMGGRRFSWGGKNLSDEGECRSRYIDALRKADTGDYAALIEFVRS
ncbi:MAG: mobile mystery protein B [Candidatus Krumholzibacteria bacterium]|nr:mobile mystery protein B [Candidatus Krumholzibacteria bacterium]